MGCVGVAGRRSLAGPDWSNHYAPSEGAHWGTPSSRWFDRLILVLAPHGLASPGETAREFALRSGDALRPIPTTEALAEIPLDWAEAYYESRFGGQSLIPERLAALESGLNRLREALAGFRHRMGEAS